MANDIGSFDGSVSAEAPGSSVETASLGSGPTGNEGMGGALGVTVDTLDLGLPTFISSPLDVAVFGAAVGTGLAVGALVLGGSPTATPIAALAGYAVAVNMPALTAVMQDSAVSANFAMDRPGAFVAESQSVGVGAISLADQEAHYRAWIYTGVGGGGE